MNRHYFLSPHPDDVVLSCGGTVFTLCGHETAVQVVNLFSAVPPADMPLSAFAAYQHEMWGQPVQAYHTRRAEETAALQVLGAAPIWLEQLECIYRGDPRQGKWYYNSDDDIFGSLHPADTVLIADLVDTLVGMADVAASVFYAPLALGNHVDHQVAFQAALQLQQRGAAVYFYEDYPYAQRHPDALHHALSGKAWQAGRVLLSTAAAEAKIKAAAAHQTQLNPLFGGEAAMRRLLPQYMHQVGQGQPAERFWFDPALNPPLELNP